MGRLIPKAVGPVAWHPLCSRYHPRREPCALHEVTRIAKSHHKVKRLAHKPVHHHKKATHE